MRHDTKSDRRVKPEKPYPGFPLFPHATGRWAKKVNGVTRYFGPWDDPAAAEAKWNAQRDDLMAGRKPMDAAGLTTTRDMVNAFLTSKKAAVVKGEISQRTFRDYYETSERLLKCFGRTRAASNLGPPDFKMLADACATWAAVTRSNEIQRVRTIFKYAYEAGILEKPIVFGPDFKKPQAKVIRAAKAAKPARLFSAVEIKTLLRKANIQLKAMILLAINCGLGNTDVSELNVEHLKLSSGILEYPRPKTAIDRRATLWPETVKALSAVLRRRGELHAVGDAKGLPRHRPADAADANAVFITHQQMRFVRQGEKSNRDSVALAFTKLLNAAGLKQDGVNFYSLRHTFETVAGATHDQPAVDRIMGHSDPHVRGQYTHWLKDAGEDARLKAVTDYVRGWLWPK